MLQEPTQKFSLSKRLESFRHASRGLYRMLRLEHNAWIHAMSTLLVVLSGLGLQVSRDDWCWLILAIGLVWAAEAFNTALECLANVASPEYHPRVRDAKDIAAGAVLLISSMAVGIGALRLLPHFYRLFVA